VLLARYGSRKDGYGSSDVTVGVGDCLGGSGRQFGLFWIHCWVWFNELELARVHGSWRGAAVVNSACVE